MQLFHKNNDKNELIIFFSGWALDFHPFAHLFSNEKDLLFVWDYRDLDFLFDFSKYKKIDVIAFSYGVFMSQLITLPKINSFTAINGTIFPIDKDFGINPKMFDLTLNNLNEKTLEKFYKNMFSNQEHYELFNNLKSQTTNIDYLKNELEFIKKCTSKNIENINYTKAIISNLDRIIPTNAQNNFWKNKTNIDTKAIDCGHFPFYNFTLDELVNNNG